MKTMLYKHPGPHKIHGGKFDYIIVFNDDIEDALKDGWFRTTGEALEGQADKPKRKRRTKAEMLAAKE